MKTKLLLSIIALLLGTLTVKPVAAEDNLVFCPQVYPCDEEGNLLPQYLNPADACFAFYASQCKQRVESIQKNLLCEETSAEVEKLRKQIKRLKRGKRTKSGSERRRK